MNIFIIEDDDLVIDTIKNNVEFAIKRVRNDWSWRYSEPIIEKIFTPEFHIGDKKSKPKASDIMEIFGGKVPHILILDWDLHWKGDVKFCGDELVKAIDRSTDLKHWNPYVVFTSSYSPTQLLEILGGKPLKRMFPTSLMLLEKEILLDESTRSRNFQVVKSAMKQALEYASFTNIELEVFPLPELEDYPPVSVTNENGKEEWKAFTKVFTRDYWKGQAKTITVSKDNIVAILTGFRESYAVLIWHEPDLERDQLGRFELLQCRFTYRAKQNYFIKRFPFLELDSGVYYNANGVTKLKKQFQLDKSKFGEDNIDEVLGIMNGHNKKADADIIYIEKQKVKKGATASDDFSNAHINMLYTPMSKFI